MNVMLFVIFKATQKEAQEVEKNFPLGKLYLKLTNSGWSEFLEILNFHNRTVIIKNQ